MQALLANADHSHALFKEWLDRYCRPELRVLRLQVPGVSLVLVGGPEMHHALLKQGGFLPKPSTYDSLGCMVRCLCKVYALCNLPGFEA